MGSRIFRFSLIKFSSTFWTEGTVDRSFNLLSSWICSSLVSIWLYMRVKKEGTQTKKTKTISLTLYMYYKNRGYGIFFFRFYTDCSCIYLYFLVIPHTPFQDCRSLGNPFHWFEHPLLLFTIHYIPWSHKYYAIMNFICFRHESQFC